VQPPLGVTGGRASEAALTEIRCPWPHVQISSGQQRQGLPHHRREGGRRPVWLAVRVL